MTDKTDIEDFGSCVRTKSRNDYAEQSLIIGLRSAPRALTDERTSDD